MKKRAKATHIFLNKKFQHICISLDVNFNESLTNDVVSFEQFGPDIYEISGFIFLKSKKKKKISLVTILGSYS